ncbi:MAG TPA: hypothetical protein VKX46_05860 [Ktedonobacteraceae bacterium]|jgi:hypothetical protein|nr:hypothetical protein [Ktedonobacteraceae bacterium]
MRRRRATFGNGRNITFDVPRKRRRLSPLALTGIVASLAVILLGVAAVLLLFPRMGIFAAGTPQQPNMNCTLIVPANPLSARGLATPYQLTATNPNDGPCHEANTDQSAFVQGVIYDPSTGAFSVYNPLVIDKGTQPAVAPIVPTLPAGAVVALWFGFDANNLLLQGAQKNTLAEAHCVNGLNRSLFTQYAYCNAVAFFAAANQGIVAHLVHVPALGTAKDGEPCPTVRDFSVVDQDQSDNVQTEYLSLPNGQIAQFSAANQKALANATVLNNPSDNALLTNFIDPTLGCQEWLAPNLADNGAMVATLALDELQASADQQAPVALVPLNDPMTTVNGAASLEKTNLYRRGVDQILAATNQEADGATYCMNMLRTGVPRLVRDKPLDIKAQSPDTGAANNLFTFLAQRFQASWTNLNCQALTGIANPVTTKTNGQGVVISATYNQADPPSNTLSCIANGQLVASCNGNVTINGQTCTFVFNQAKDQVQLTCPREHQ